MSTHQRQALIDRFENALSTARSALAEVQSPETSEHVTQQIDACTDTLRTHSYVLLLEGDSQPEELAAVDHALEQFSNWFERSKSLIAAATDFRNAIAALLVIAESDQNLPAQESMNRGTVQRAEKLADLYARHTASQHGDSTGRGGDRTGDLLRAAQSPVLPEGINQELKRVEAYVSTVRFNAADDFYNK